MRYLLLVWAGFARDPLRAALTTGSVAVAFALLWILKGLDAGIERRMESIPEDLLHVSGRFPGYLPLASLYTIERIPGVSDVAHLMYHNSRYRTFKGGVTLLAVDIERYLRVAYDVRIDPAAVQTFLNTPGAAIAGAGSAKSFGWKVGDRISLKPIGLPLDEWSFLIVGIWDHDISSPDEAKGLIVSYSHVDQTLPAEGAGLVAGLVGGFAVKATDARHVGAVAAAIDEQFRNSSAPTLTARTRQVMMSGRRPDQVRLAANMIVGAALFAILFCTAGVMAQSVRDRYREFAMMKSLGFGGGALLFGVAGESLLICATGALIALIPAAMIDVGALLGRYGAVVYPPPWSLYPIGFAMSLLLAGLSIILPGWRVLRLSPAEVAR
ncbi:MAG: ABC transporter permease [Gammaproteobacteria bacterium]|nr:ABC transporter permease [Gammaproteobacteria bacterium]